MMKYAQKIRRRNYVLLALFIGIYVCASTCTSSDPSLDSAKNSKGQSFAAPGSVACRSCHKNIYQRHIATAHYRDSRPALATYIKGSFDSGRNRFVYNQSTEVLLEHRSTAFSRRPLSMEKNIRASLSIS